MKTDSLKEFVLDQLRRLDGLKCRAMFGGHGLYASEKFFGILLKGRLYFKTNAATCAQYLARGMKPFRPNVKQELASYFEVPADVMEDAAQLETWAREAIKIGGE